MKEAKKALRAAVRAAGANVAGTSMSTTSPLRGTPPNLIFGLPPSRLGHSSKLDGARLGVGSQGGESLRAREELTERKTPLLRNEGWQPKADGVVAQIEALSQFTTARTVALFCSLPDEVPTGEMLNRWLGKKRLALPIVEGNEMTFREYTGEDCLCTGAFGISTPGSEAVIPPEEIDLMLIPGVAFDPAGRRLGRGKGFYDRYLAQPAAAHIYKVGLCLPHGMVARVPAEAHDIKMNRVITF